MNNTLNQRISIRTPLLNYYSYEDNLDARIYLKPENLQPFGSYKVRGIESVFQKTPAKKLKQGVCAASAGNMGQALAYMASQHNIPCTIYVPDSTPYIKKARIQSLGAHLVERPFQAIWDLITTPPSNETLDDKLFIHPVKTAALLEGYEDIAKEIIADLPDVDAIIIPFGIGGLATSLSNVIKQQKPDTAIFLCEPETAASFKASIAIKRPANIAVKKSFVDAIGTPTVLPYVFEQLHSKVEDSEVVTLSDAHNALHKILLNNKLLCEGAAGCSLAAAINLSKKTAYKKIVSILTGGNISTDDAATLF